MEPNNVLDKQTSTTPIAQKWRSLILWLTIIFSGLSVYTIYVTLQSVCSGLGCIGMLPFYIPTLLTFPALSYLSWLTDGVMIRVLSAPSFFKFYAFFVIFVNLFIIGCIVAWFYLDYKRRKDGLKIEQGISKDVKYVIRKFGINLFIIFFLFSLLQFVAHTPPPFVPDHEILLYCSDNSSCFNQYINYKIPDCSGRGKIFLWPYEREIGVPDNCKLSNFSEFAKFGVYNLDEKGLIQSYSGKFPHSYAFKYALGKHGLRNEGDLVYEITTPDGITITQTSLSGVLYNESSIKDRNLVTDWDRPKLLRINTEEISINNIIVYADNINLSYDGWYEDESYEVIQFVKGNTYFKITNEKKSRFAKNDTQEIRKEKIDSLMVLARNFIER